MCAVSVYTQTHTRYTHTDVQYTQTHLHKHRHTGTLVEYSLMCRLYTRGRIMKNRDRKVIKKPRRHTSPMSSAARGTRLIYMRVTAETFWYSFINIMTSARAATRTVFRFFVRSAAAAAAAARSHTII